MTDNGSCIALGFFDGVHIAHKKIICSAVMYAEKNGFSPIVLTFDKSPQEFFGKEVSYITDCKEKKKLISKIGAETIFLHTDSELLSLSAEDFVKKYLADMYNARMVVCGYNYKFGKDGSGDANTLRVLGEKYGFSVETVQCIEADGEVVSSSRVRKLISSGDMEKAKLLLGRYFSVSGTVERGKQLGYKLGFPTANIYLSENKVIPKCGVYASNTYIDGKRFRSITNVGINPTVGGERLRAETYIKGISYELYGREINVELLRFIRPETVFKNTEELKRQIANDIQITGIFD